MAAITYCLCLRVANFVPLHQWAGFWSTNLPWFLVALGLFCVLKVKLVAGATECVNSLATKVS